MKELFVVCLNFKRIEDALTVTVWYANFHVFLVNFDMASFQYHRAVMLIYVLFVANYGLIEIR